MAPPLCRTPLEMESRKMFPWCDLDILRALWRSTMFPCRRQCRRQESGKVGIPVSNHNPQLLFGPHPAQSQSTQRLQYSDPDRFQLLFATHFVSLWFPERENRENVWVSWKQLEATQKCQKPGLGPIISSTCLPEHEVVRAEQLAERSGTNAIHGACNNIWQSEAIKTATHKPQSLFRIWLPRMLADFTPMRHQFRSIPTSNMCECSAESQCPMSAEMRCTYWKHLESCFSDGSGQCTWLEVHQNSTWHIAATCCLVEVNVDALLAAKQSTKANRRHPRYQ